MSVKNNKWVAINGNLFVDHVEERFNRDFKVKYRAREVVAFNIGQEIAEYLASIHNRELETKHAIGHS